MDVHLTALVGLYIVQVYPDFSWIYVGLAAVWADLFLVVVSCLLNQHSLESVKGPFQ